MGCVFAGVDGCTKGWVALVLPSQELVEGFARFADLAEHLRRAGVTTIAVDMPLSAPERGERACDLAVRAALGRKRASLFITPTRAALACATQSEATVVNRRHGGKGVSAQAFALRHKIAEVAGQVGLIEVHPELTFHLLGDPKHSKRTWAGLRERVDILRAEGLEPWSWSSQGWAAADDTLDAAAAAVTARRFAQGRAARFPHTGATDVIWA